MSCAYAEWDGSYVLGALSPAERLEFEQHLAGCVECARGVRELAGLPGLLGRVGADVLAESAVIETPPDTLLPRLVREVRRTQRLRRLVVAGGAAAAAVVVLVAVAVFGGFDGDGGVNPDSPPVASQPMDRIGEPPVRATVALESVTWGTRLDLTCTYAPADTGYRTPRSVVYAIVVRTRDGRTEQVGTWKSVQGKTMKLTAGTSATRAEIRSVEVRTTQGKAVLRLAG